MGGGGGLGEMFGRGLAAGGTLGGLAGGISSYGTVNSSSHGGGYGTGRTSDYYNGLSNSVAGNPNLTAAQKVSTGADYEKYYQDQLAFAKSSGQAGWGVEYDYAARQTAAHFAQQAGDLARDVAGRKVYIQEQFNALNTGVNSKLQQTRITSFLGATAARASL